MVTLKGPIRMGKDSNIMEKMIEADVVINTPFGEKKASELKTNVETVSTIKVEVESKPTILDEIKKAVVGKKAPAKKKTK